MTTAQSVKPREEDKKQTTCCVTFLEGCGILIFFVAIFAGAFYAHFVVSNMNKVHTIMNDGIFNKYTNTEENIDSIIDTINEETTSTTVDRKESFTNPSLGEKTVSNSRTTTTTTAPSKDILIAWQETLEIRNEVDRTHFNALRDGFFGVGLLVSLAAFLTSFKSKRGEIEREREKEKIKREIEAREQASPLYLSQEQFEEMVERKAVELKIEASPASKVHIKSGEKPNDDDRGNHR